MHSFARQDIILHTYILFNNHILKLLLGIYIMTFYYNISCRGNRGRYEIRRETTICKVNVIKQLQHFVECRMLFYGTLKAVLCFKYSIKKNYQPYQTVGNNTQIIFNMTSSAQEECISVTT